MSTITKKRMIDDALNILARFSLTDDHRLAAANRWLSMKIDQIRADLIIKEYQENNIIDQTWLTDLGLYPFNQVNYSDDPNVLYCCSDISKAFIPNVVSITSKQDSNIDLGLFSIISACGTKEYYPFPITTWKIIPKEHVRSKFNYYFRINTALYVNKKVNALRIMAVLASPEDGYIVQSEPVITIITGTIYIVKGGQIIYNNVVQVENSIFTGASGATSYTGTGKAYLENQLNALNDTQPYPVSADMARMITIELCTKEFGIEGGRVTDILNDSVDDTQAIKTG